jgi:hypothetical protein
MKYPIIKKGIYTLRTFDEYPFIQTISIIQTGINVEISFFNSLFEKIVIIKGNWILNQKNSKYILNLINNNNNKKMFFSVDKCYNDYFTLVGGYDDENNHQFQIDK